jgi:hypothetical protein
VDVLDVVEDTVEDVVGDLTRKAPKVSMAH